MQVNANRSTPPMRGETQSACVFRHFSAFGVANSKSSFCIKISILGITLCG